MKIMWLSYFEGKKHFSFVQSSFIILFEKKNMQKKKQTENNQHQTKCSSLFKMTQQLMLTSDMSDFCRQGHTTGF